MSDIIENYLEIIQGDSVVVITEDISSLISRFKNIKVSEISDKLKTALKTKNANLIIQTIRKYRIPQVDPDKLIELAKKKGADVRKNYDLTIRVLQNTFENVKELYLKLAALMVVIKSIADKIPIRVAIKKFVKMVRWIKEKLKNNFPESPEANTLELFIGIAIVYLGIAVLYGASVAAVVLMENWWLLWTVLILTVIVVTIEMASVSKAINKLGMSVYKIDKNQAEI